MAVFRAPWVSLAQEQFLFHASQGHQPSPPDLAYFPLLVPECLLIEPTETETKEELDGFVEAMIKIQQEAENSPDLLKEAPHTQPVRRLDEVRAAKQLDLAWSV